MQQTIRASLNIPSSVQKYQRRVSERRRTFENVRRKNMQLLNQDLRKIAEREFEYSKSVLEALLPIKVSWNEDAWEKMKEKLPVKVEWNRENEALTAMDEDDDEPESETEVVV
jgi:hypothetical protein